MRIAEAADGKLIVDTADSSLVCNLTTLKTSKDEGAHRLFEASGFWMELYVPKEMVGHINPRSAAELISNQMKVVITKCKWPSSMPGKPQRRNKFITAHALSHKQPLSMSCGHVVERCVFFCLPAGNLGTEVKASYLSYVQSIFAGGGVKDGGRVRRRF